MSNLSGHPAPSAARDAFFALFCSRVQWYFAAFVRFRILFRAFRPGGLSLPRGLGVLGVLVRATFAWDTGVGRIAPRTPAPKLAGLFSAESQICLAVHLLFGWTILKVAFFELHRGFRSHVSIHLFIILRAQRFTCVTIIE